MFGAGRQALGFLPDPQMSVHSLGALAERTNAQNVRILVEMAREGAFGPGEQVQAASSQQEASSEDSTETQSAAVSEEGPPGLSASGAKDGNTPTPQIDALQHDPDHVVGTVGSPPNDASSAKSNSHTDAVTQRQDVTEPHTGECSGSVEQEKISPHKRSRLGALLGRLRPRKHRQPAPAAAQSPQSNAGPPSSEGGLPSSDQCSFETQQHVADHGAEQSETAAAGREVPTHPGGSSAPEATQIGEHSSSETLHAAQPAPRTSVAPAALNGKKSSSARADALDHAQGDHGSSAAGDESDTRLPDVRLDWAVMNQSMMHSLHSFVTTLTTALVAQVSTEDFPTIIVLSSEPHQTGV